MHSVCAVVTDLVPFCRLLLCNLSMCYACRIALCFGWLCFLNVSVLFWPIAHNSFLHQLTGVPYPVLIRFHRYQNTLQFPCHSDHLLTHSDATLLHNLFIHETCCMTGNILNCMSHTWCEGTLVAARLVSEQMFVDNDDVSVQQRRTPCTLKQFWCLATRSALHSSLLQAWASRNSSCLLLCPGVRISCMTAVLSLQVGWTHYYVVHHTARDLLLHLLGH